MKIQHFFEKFEGYSLSYGDLIFLPSYVDFSLAAVSLQTAITETIVLPTPVISSPMDTVTEADLAIALALEGGLGILHYNCSIEQQLEQIQKVKRYQNGVVLNPIALPPNAAIRDVVSIRKERGYSIIPITSDGTSHGRLVGMITKYDYSTFSEHDLSKRVSERMIYVENLTVATYEELCVEGSFDLNQANERLLNSHSAALPIVDREGHLRFLITRSDLDKHQNYPHSAVDNAGSLLVGAAVETWPEKAKMRIEAIESDVDLIVFDTSQGYTQFEVELIRWTKAHFPDLQIIAGNVVTQEACTALLEAGADAIRVGMGSGSICTTQEVGGIGRGQATAVYACAKACHERGKRCIADGGIKTSSDMAKAFCLGADAVMLGSLLACTTEAPGKTHIKNGVRLKEYRGMGSLKAMERGSSVRYGIENSAIRIPEGVSGMVSSRGSISEWVPCLMQGVRQGLHKMGHDSLEAIQQKIATNDIELERRSESAKQEGNVHSLFEVGSDLFSTAQSTFSKKQTPTTEVLF